MPGPNGAQSGFFVVASESASTTTSTFAWFETGMLAILVSKDVLDANLPVQIVRFLNTDLCLLWYCPERGI
jgi:hypothetical protein